MAHGRLGAIDLPATTYSTVYTVPISTKSTVNVSLANRTAGPINVRLAVGGITDIPANSDFVNYDTPLAAYSSLEKKGIALGAGEKVVVYSSAPGVSVQAQGVSVSA